MVVDEAEAGGVGARVRAVREGRSLTQAEVAERAGVRWLAISRLENGHTRPRPGTVRKLAEALGVPVETLTGAEGLPRLGESLGTRPKGVSQRERPHFEGTPAADAVSEGRGD